MCMHCETIKYQQEGMKVMNGHVIEDANRCLQCDDSPCQSGCPVQTPITMMNQAIQEGNLLEAGKMLFENNPLSLICSLVCDHAFLCEGNCVLKSEGHPVQIGNIEHYISDTTFDQMEIPCLPNNGKKVAVIGAGPAGITVAFKLAQRGYGLTIFESKDKIGGMTQYGIPEFRLPKSILERYKKKLLSIGVKFRPNTTVGTALTIQDLIRDGYASIFIGTGVWRPKMLGVKGETMGNVHYAIDYLETPNAYDLGNSVAIIGTGNTAMDVARTALRHGSRNVTFYATSTKISATEREAAYARLDGARFEFGKRIVEITDEGPVFETSIFDRDGNIVGKEEGLDQVQADSTIISISQGPMSRLISTTEGLEANERGLLVTDERGQTTLEGVFAAGDVVHGARSVVDAVAASKLVADEMDKYMQG